MARRLVEAGERPALIERSSWRRNNAYAVLMCLRAVDRLHDLAGMRGMTEGGFIQRAWRDAHAGASQVAIAWDAQASVYGRTRFGRGGLAAAEAGHVLEPGFGLVAEARVPTSRRAVADSRVSVRRSASCSTPITLR